MEKSMKPNRAAGMFFGCVVWLLIVSALLTCLMPVAIFGGLLSGMFVAEPVAQIVGPMLCPDNTTPVIDTFSTTTIDENGFEVPATGIEMQCLGADGQPTAEPSMDYQDAWIGILMAASVLLSVVIAFFVAGPVGILVNKLLDRMRAKKSV